MFEGHGIKDFLLSWQGSWTAVTNALYSLALTLRVVQFLRQQICGIIPVGYFRRLRSIISGTGLAYMASGQEVLE